MVIVMRHNATEEEISQVMAKLEQKGFKVHLSKGVERTIIGVIGDETGLADIALGALPGVEAVVPILQPYKLASRIMNEAGTIIRVGDVEIGGQ
ncbi:3-deoxy-7-phosphoheptulonate synthase, partial [Desulforudis sp. 1190]